MSFLNPVFLSVHQATVKHFGKVIFQELDFVMKHGQHWIITGASGAEKTAFLNTLAGRTILTDGWITKEFAREYQETKIREGQVNSYKDLVAFVSQKYEFKNKANIQNFYYQQRFNSSESEETYTVKEFLQQIEVKRSGYWDLPRVLEILNLESLKDKSLIKLSNGETRRLAIAAALIKNPVLFLMDQPMTGLDVQTRAEFGSLLQVIIDSGIHVIMTSSGDDIPEAITHVGVLENGKFCRTVKKEEFEGASRHSGEAGKFDFEPLAKLIDRSAIPLYHYLIRMQKVSIRYGEKLILDKVSWEVKPGEFWVLQGHNGAGKSTLLSLVNGENPQAYANDILLFDRKRGTGETIWDIKKNIGFVSPELSRYFPKNQNCLQVVLSGLWDTMGLFKKASSEQEMLAKSWLSFFNMGSAAVLPLSQVSLDQQRFCLLARALIKSPPLLLLDEAAQGMDDDQRILFREIIEVICAKFPIALIYVSHYEEDIPACVQHKLVLKEGRVIENTSLEKIAFR